MGVGYYEETNANLTYNGTWDTYTGSEPSGGSTRYTTEQDAYVSFSFTGNKLTLYRVKYTNRGLMEVCIDGVCQAVNNYATTMSWTQPWQRSDLDTETHVVTITNLEAGKYLDLDAVEVEVANPPQPLPAGYHQETDQRLVFSGTWQVGTDSNASGGTTNFTTEQNASAAFRFDGAGLVLYRVLADNRGLMEVCIDDACENVDNYSATLQWAQPWEKSGLEAGVHEVTVRNLEAGKYLDLDAVEVFGLLPAGYHEETDERLSFSGTWTHYPNSNASGGSTRYTTQQGAKVRFSFTGNKLTLYRALANNRGLMEVCIDGVCQAVNNYAATMSWTQPWQRSDLDTETHVVTITNLEAGKYLDLDAVEVEVADPPQPLPAGYHQETDQRLVFSGTWQVGTDSNASGGTTNFTTEQNASAAFRFDGAGLVLYRVLADNRGLMEVCIDDACENVDNYSATLQWAQPWEKSGLETGVHEVTVRNLEAGKYLDLDAVEVSGLPAPLTIGYHEQTDERLVFSEGWTHYPHSSAGGGSTRYTTAQDASVTFRIDGAGVVLYRVLADNRGLMEVCIDGVCENVNNYSTTLQWTQPWEKTGLDAGVHTVTVTNLDAGKYLDLDAVEVLPERTWHYSYDGLSRVTLACSDGWDDVAETCAGDAFIYEYDGAGNLTRFDKWNADTGQVDTVRYVINGANQIACIDDISDDGVCDDGEFEWEYDAFGNLLNDGTTTYTYDAANRVETITAGGVTTTYTYNGDGDRIAQEVDDGAATVETTYVLDTATPLTMVLSETTGSETTRYWHALDTLAQSDGTTPSYFGYDGLGSVRQLVDETGSVTLAQTFDPYGKCEPFF